ncbi:MAG: hypothetical protein EZS28_036476 [Streblomastix strix]|uniref:Uncharacterized protein n=1 Tax=Streblomastix strix TaxID=222440 RepID=A0A5J4UB16_9EUKA|nr:MAG: hypothetical protein EZS28_036476 [Streblomastix strix]
MITTNGDTANEDPELRDCVDEEFGIIGSFGLRGEDQNTYYDDQLSLQCDEDDLLDPAVPGLSESKDDLAKLFIQLLTNALTQSVGFQLGYVSILYSDQLVFNPSELDLEGGLGPRDYNESDNICELNDYPTGKYIGVGNRCSYELKRPPLPVRDEYEDLID